MKKRFLSWFIAYLATAVTVQAAPTVNFGYDGVGRLQSQTTALGFQNSFNYDAFSRLSTVTFPTGHGSAGYQYNGQDTPVQVTDPRGLVTAYDADGFGQFGGVASPDTGSAQNTYDEAGNLTKRVLAGGQAVSFSYDAVDRIISVSASDFSTSFEYDAGAVGQLTGMTDDAGRTDWTYDTKGRVATKTQTIDGRSWAVGYGWQGDILTQLTYPSGRVVTFALDHGRITSVSVDGQAALTGVTYLAMGGVSGWTMGAAGSYVRNFDVHGRITGYTGPDGQRTLTLDDDNRVTAIKEASGAVVGSYGYDSMGRLVSAVDGGIARSYAYDLNGNRTQLSVGGASYSVDISTSSNQISFASLPNVGAGSYDHDANGNLTSNGRSTLQWNSLGYATNAATSSGSVDFNYNGFGQRVRKAAGATGTRYYVYAEDNQTLLGEYDATGQPVAEYVYLEGLPALVLKSSGTYFVLPDHLGTPRGIKNGAGEVVWRWDADAFGNGVPIEDVAGAGTFESNLRFPGQVFDRETGLHYNNARYYDPAVGRYVSSDPIGLEGGLNTYSYVNGQPTGLVDPSGNWFVVTAALGAGIGAGLGAAEAWVTNGDIRQGAIHGAIAGGIAGLTAGVGGPLLGGILRSQFLAGSATGVLSSTAADLAVQGYEINTKSRCSIDFMQTAKNAAIGGVFGLTVFRPGTVGAQRVVSYANRGSTPVLVEGTWVMAGGHSVRNYLATGKPAAAFYPIKNRIEATMFPGSLRAPSGPAGNINYLMGQRRIK